MIVARSAWDLRRAIDSMTRKAVPHPIDDIVRERPRVAFIPTMGALHEGHLSLVRSARDDGAPITVASVFVNPSQFSEGEDFAEYPRSEERDLQLLDGAGIDVAFVPTVDDIYPPGFGTKVVADEGLASCLCGASRGSDHFNGVVTVVARLFGLVQPDSAWFGEKDWQQLQIIKTMASDIHPGVEVLGSPTVRAADGVALSSRNSYLDDASRPRAGAVPEAIGAAQAVAGSGGSVTESLTAGLECLKAAQLEVDYFEIRSSRKLRTVESFQTAEADSADPPRIFVAAWLDGVRLIDNESLFLNSTSPSDQQGE
jgi:pantoate--beta-alanine ligase